MVIISFILLAICVCVVIFLSAHFARKSEDVDPETPQTRTS
jgi:ABC-type multidrug transport system permease subunit